MMGKCGTSGTGGADKAERYNNVSYKKILDVS
jgi:hypothetical protein